MDHLDICARRHGVAHRDELSAIGLSKDAIHGLVRKGSLIRELPRVYRARGAPRTWIQIVAAVSLWAGVDTGVTGRAGAAVYGLDGFEQQGPIDLVTTRFRRSPRADVRLRRVSDLPMTDLQEVRGIVVARPARLLLDLGRTLSRDDLEKAIERAIHRRLVTREALTKWLQGHRAGTDGLAALRAVLDRRSRYRATESDLETECVQALRKEGAPLPTRQWCIEGERGRIGRIDLAYPEQRIGIEVDSYEWHGDYLSFHRDRERYNAAVSAGWTLLLYTKRIDSRLFAQQVLTMLTERRDLHPRS